MGKQIDHTSYELCFSNLPAAFHGCRIGFLADLHNSKNKKHKDAILVAAKAGNFDFFVCGGDMIIGSDSGNFYYEEALSFLEQLRKIAPIYYSLGNHEERMRGRIQGGQDVLLTFKTELNKRNIIVVDDTTQLLYRGKDAIGILGLSLGMEYYRRWWNRTKLSKEEIEKKIGNPRCFTILLAHNPVYFPIYDAYGAALVLSGHVHGGLLVLPYLGGVISPEHQLFPKYDFGLFKGKQAKMILSRGLGAHTLPIRINNRPEFITIQLKNT
ncbi:MAG: uncharacterized protein PWP24_1914 [Clostridiales bacterium]|nr:uncharacterized protein [Clostridiales bacterium]